MVVFKIYGQDINVFGNGLWKLIGCLVTKYISFVYVDKLLNLFGQLFSMVTCFLCNTPEITNYGGRGKDFLIKAVLLALESSYFI